MEADTGTLTTTEPVSSDLSIGPEDVGPHAWNLLASHYT
jgi:hypothetical protein